MLKKFKKKGIVIISLVFLLYCKEEKDMREVQYIASKEGVNLSLKRQEQAFGNWRLTNMMITDYDKKDKKKIVINIPVTIKKNGVYSNNKMIAYNYANSVGTYYFQNLDTLSTVFYIREIEDNRLMMKTPNLYRIERGKKTTKKIRAELFFIKE